MIRANTDQIHAFVFQYVPIRTQIHSPIRAQYNQIQTYTSSNTDQCKHHRPMHTTSFSMLAFLYANTGIGMVKSGAPARTARATPSSTGVSEVSDSSTKNGFLAVSDSKSDLRLGWLELPTSGSLRQNSSQASSWACFSTAFSLGPVACINPQALIHTIRWNRRTSRAYPCPNMRLDKIRFQNIWKNDTLPNPDLYMDIPG